MERIIKIFRRVMLAVIIIPFMSVFAMPDYNSVFAVETPRFAGLTLWDKNGGYLTTDSAVDSEHLLSQNTTVNFGGSTVRYSISGSGDIVLSLGGGMTLGNNSRGNSIENSGNQTVTIQTGNLNLLGGVLTEGNLSFEGTLEEVDPFHDRIGASIGALSVNSQTGIVSEKGDVSIRNYKSVDIRTLKDSIVAKNVKLSLSDGTLTTTRNGNQTLTISSSDGIGVNANGLEIRSIGSDKPGSSYSFDRYNIEGTRGALTSSVAVVNRTVNSLQKTQSYTMFGYSSSAYTDYPTVVMSSEEGRYIPLPADVETYTRFRTGMMRETTSNLSLNSVAFPYGEQLNANVFYSGGNGAPVSLEYSEDGVEWLSYNKENNLKPGNYDVRIRQMSDIANFRIGKEVVGEGSLVVNRGTLNSTSFKAINVSQIYDGLSHPVTPEYVDGLVGTNANIQTTYTTFEGQDITGTPKDAGVYRVFATVPADGDNYLATAEPVEVGTITILPANVPSEHINVADLSHVFDGKDHEATVSLDNKYGDITSVKYKTEDGVVVDKPTNAGRYEVLLSTSSKNYVSLDNEVVGVLNITKATPTAKDFKFDSEKTYTGSKLDAKVVSTNDLMTTEAAGALTVKYNGDANQPVNAGKYDVTVETAGGTNYNPVTLDLGTFEITKAPVTKANLTGKANNATYDGKEHSASYDWKAGMVGTGALTLTYKGEGYNSTVAPVTAGTYDVYASAPAGDNYQALESVKIADLKISKADLDAKNFNDVSANYVYDFKSHPAKVAYLPGTEGTAPITVTYKTAAGKAVSGAPTNAGTYEVYAQAVKDGVNYNAMAKPVKVGTIKIAKADKPLPQIKVSDNKFTYDGKSHQAKVTMDKKYGDLSVTYKDEKGKIVAKPTNTGVYQIIANTVSDNFEELHDITVGELTIEGLTPKSSEFTFTKSGTYNGKSQSAKVAFAPGVTEAMAGKMTVHYVDAKGNKTNSITNAGTYKVYVSTTGGTNFKPVNNLLVGSMTIAKAPVASDKFSVKNTEVTFNGQSQSPTVTLPAKYGDITKIEYRDENGKIYDKVENPGKYDILVTTKGTANYAGADRLVIGTFTIDEQTPEPTPTPAPNDNGGNAGGGTTPAASTVVPASGPTAYNATTTVPAVTAATTPSAVAPATQTMGTQTQATATPAADNATIRHGAVTDPLHGPEEVNDPVTSVAQKDTQGLSNYTIAGIWMAVAVALAGAFYIGMRWMQVGRKRHLMQK